MITRRNLMKTAAAGLTLPALTRSGFAAEPLKVGFVYLGAIGDYGWTWSHEQGRKALDAALKGQVVTSYVENVKEDASAIPVMKDLAQQGNKLIFTTSYGYMEQTLEAAKQFPDVKWEHCTGYKRADNVGTYNSRFYQGRAVTGTIAGMMSKTGTIGFLGSFKIPEVVMIDPWFDPAKEAAAAETLANLGCDVIAQHVDSPATLQVCEKRKIYGFGYGADMSRFAPHAHLTASLDLWGPYYIERAKAMLDGSWKSDDIWWGMKEGLLGMAPYNKNVPDNVRAAADKIIADTKAGTYEVFTRPISDQDGKERIAKGQRMEDKDLLVMDWYVKGVQS